MIKVTIIDDSRIIGERLSIMLNDIDEIMVTGQATNASDGLELVRASKPDFVVLDINLPDTSGLEIIKDIKNMDPEIMIAMLTNYPYPGYRTRSKDLGADYFFDKSKEFGKLIETLTELARIKNEIGRAHV